jgi:hypothetical protein
MIRIAMWSGPRNLSTAMMRSFGSRADTHCVDEPFYAAYLALTGLDHPMRAEILASQSSDADAVARRLADEPAPAAVFYQKHMTHHMVAGVPRDWMAGVRHAFLIRHPARVLASYAKKMESVSLDAIGFSQQAELFDQAASLTGEAPVVVDSEDILGDPRRLLSALCAALGIGFDEKMLSWPAGRKTEDGAWAPHWYEAVWASTGFAAQSDAPLQALPDELALVCEQAKPFYEKLAAHKLA